MPSTAATARPATGLVTTNPDASCRTGTAARANPCSSRSRTTRSPAPETIT
jgi:hypothetical protein